MLASQQLYYCGGLLYYESCLHLGCLPKSTPELTTDFDIVSFSDSSDTIDSMNKLDS